MRYPAMACVLAISLWAGSASATRYTDEGRVNSLTVMQDGSLRLRLVYQQCAVPITISAFYAGRSYSLLMQALLQSRSVRITSDTSRSTCQIAAVEFL